MASRFLTFVNTKLLRRKVWGPITVGGLTVCFVVTAVLTFGVPAGATRTVVTFPATAPVDGGQVTDTIEGLICDPASTPHARKPAVVLVHGFTCSKEYMQSFSVELARRGILTLSISMQGHGMSTGGSRGSEISPYATIAAIDYLLARVTEFNLDPARLGLVGHSQGGMTVTKAGFLDHRVNVTVAVAAPSLNVTGGVFGLADPADMEDALGFGFDPRPLTSFINASYPRNYLYVMGDLDEFVDEVDARVMIAAGTDQPVDAVERGRLYWTAAGTARQYLTYSWITHNQECFDARLVTDAIEWLERSLSLDNPAPIRLTEHYRFHFMMVGFVLGILSIFPVTSYLASALLPGRRDLPGKRNKGAEGTDDQPSPGATSLKDMIPSLAAYVLVGGLVGGTLALARAPLKPWLSLLGYNAIPLLCGTGLVMIPVIYGLSRTTWRDLPLDQDGWFAREALGRQVGFGLAVGGYVVLVANLGFGLFWINLWPVGPRLLPFLLGLVLCLPVGLSSSIFFNGYLLARVQERWSFWKSAVGIAILTALVKGLAFGLAFPLFVTNWPFGNYGGAVLLYGGVAALLTFVFDLIDRWAYFQTRSVLAAALVTTVTYAFGFTQILPMLP